MSRGNLNMCVSASFDNFFSANTVKATMYDPHGTELSGERGTSTAFSGEGERHHRESSCLALVRCLLLVVFF